MNYDGLFLGFLVSAAFHEVTGLYPGGIVVPAFLALYVDRPSRLLGTLAASGLGLLIYRLASRHMILFGKRRFFVIVTATAFVSAAGSYLLPAAFSAPSDLRAVGVVVPGLIANACERQGFVATAASTCVAVALVFLLDRLLGGLR